MNVKTYVTTNKWIFSIIKKSEESKKLDARVRKNKGKEERKKKKRKIAANVLIVRKTFGFKSWQQFSMQRGKIRNSQFLRFCRSFIRASRLQELDWGAKVFALLFL